MYIALYCIPIETDGVNTLSPHVREQSIMDFIIEKGNKKISLHIKIKTNVHSVRTFVANGVSKLTWFHST